MATSASADAQIQEEDDDGLGDDSPFTFNINNFDFRPADEIYFQWDLRDPTLAEHVEQYGADMYPTVLDTIANIEAWDEDGFQSEDYQEALEAVCLQHEQDLRYIMHLWSCVESANDQKFPQGPVRYTFSRSGNLVKGIMHAYLNGSIVLLEPYRSTILSEPPTGSVSHHTHMTNLRDAWEGTVHFSRHPHMPPHIRAWLKEFMKELKAEILLRSTDHPDIADVVDVYS